MLFFLGGGAGPALLSAFLAACREGRADALNPFDTAPFSDAFLLLGLCSLLALLAAVHTGRSNHPADDVH